MEIEEIDFPYARSNTGRNYKNRETTDDLLRAILTEIKGLRADLTEDDESERYSPEMNEHVQKVTQALLTRDSEEGEKKIDVEKSIDRIWEALDCGD